MEENPYASPPELEEEKRGIAKPWYYDVLRLVTVVALSISAAILLGAWIRWVGRTGF